MGIATHIEHPAFGAVAWWTHIAGFFIGIVFALVSKPVIARLLRN